MHFLVCNPNWKRYVTVVLSTVHRVVVSIGCCLVGNNGFCGFVSFLNNASYSSGSVPR